MKALFITSEIGTRKKTNGIITAFKLENTNDFLINLQSSLPQRRLALFFASSPESADKNDMYANVIQESFALSGLGFEKSMVIDDRILNIQDLINQADLLYFMGGQTLKQKEFFERINLKSLIANFNGVIIGESAGAINMASDAYESREEITEKSHWYEGLGLTQYRIEPHFSENNRELIEQTLIPDSEKKSFIALENRSYIFVKNNITTLYGNAWIFENGKYYKINEKDNKVVLTNTQLENEMLK